MSDNVEPRTENTDNSVIKQIREEYKKAVEELKAKEDQLKEYQKKVQEFENEKLSAEERAKNELDALKNRLNELEPLKERLEKTEQAAKELYEQALGKIPEDKRDVVKSLTIKDSYVESFKAIEVVRENFLKEIKFGKPEPVESVKVEMPKSEQPKSIAEDFRSINLKEAISSRLSASERENALRMKKIMEEVE